MQGAPAQEPDKIDFILDQMARDDLSPAEDAALSMVFDALDFEEMREFGIRSEERLHAYFGNGVERIQPFIPWRKKRALDRKEEVEMIVEATPHPAVQREPIPIQQREETSL